MNRQMRRQMILVAPTCTCCEEPSALVPRDDLPGDMVACASTGQLYRREDGPGGGTRYVPTGIPELPPRNRPARGVRIDLSRAGYA